MKIGKSGPAVTSISTADAQSITVRGHDLCTELMGQVSFTEYFYLLVTGNRPTDRQTRFLDALLVSIAEHGLVPTNQVARMTLAADPASLHGAVAAGILGCGPVVLGTAESCGAFLTELQAETVAKGDPAAAAAHKVQVVREAGGRVPGFGHPLHKNGDPRADRLFSLADEEGVAGTHTGLARQIHASVAEAYGKPLPMNVSMAIAAILLDLDFPATMIKAIPILARTGGLLAHLAEEKERPIGFVLSEAAEEAISFEPKGPSS